MKFQKGQSGNPNGRPKGSKNKLDIKTIKLKSALRKLEGHVDEAILVSAEIMNSPTATEASRLKAAMFFFQEYIKLTSEVYEEEKDEEEQAPHLAEVVNFSDGSEFLNQA